MTSTTTLVKCNMCRSNKFYVIKSAQPLDKNHSYFTCTSCISKRNSDQRAKDAFALYANRNISEEFYQMRMNNFMKHWVDENQIKGM